MSWPFSRLSLYNPYIFSGSPLFLGRNFVAPVMPTFSYVLPSPDEGRTFDSNKYFDFTCTKEAYKKDYNFDYLTTDSPSNKSVKIRRFNYSPASGYGKYSNNQLRQIYGNYTKDATVLYKGTAEDLNRYLRKKGKLAGKGQAFIDAQNKYGVSAAVLAAICVNETGHGTSDLAKYKNNVGGVRKPGSYEFRRFASVEDCIDYMGSFLKDGYLDKGLTQLYQINARYCPASDPTDRSGRNSRWARAVNQFANEIESQLA